MEKNSRLVDLLPMLAFLGYWLYAGLVPAIMTGDSRLVLLGLVTLPALAAMAAALWRASGRGQGAGPQA